MLLTPAIFTTGFFLSIFVSLGLLTDVVRADLKYYLYIEDEGALHDTINKDGAAGEVVVLESVGSLPFEKSSYSAVGGSCPTVTKAGGMNSRYLCIGSHEKSNENVVFFPIAPAPGHDSTTASILPLRFGSLEESHGTSSGLLLFRNALAVDWLVPTTTLNEGTVSLNAISYGRDNSRDGFNMEWLRSAASGYKDGQIVAEWNLLTEAGGDPILDGGSIQFIKGKPLPAIEQKQLSDGGNKTLAAANISNSSQPETSAVTCQSITQNLCDDKNNDKFSTICSLLMQVGLDDVLSSPSSNSYTLYAPTNEAFSRAFGKNASPALLSGHDLTKLLLSHLFVGDNIKSSQTQSISGQNPLRYEDMVCGAKQIMASQQVTKIGCDANAEVSYVTGAGNQNMYKPSFLAVDQETCNGIIHTLDYVILPASTEIGDEQIQHHHDHHVVDIDTTGGPGEGKSSTRKNNLDESALISFFNDNIGQVDDAEDNMKTTSSTAATIEANNEGGPTFGNNDVHPVRRKDVNPVNTPQTNEQPRKIGDGELGRDHSEQDLGQGQRRLKRREASNKSRQGNLRRPN